MRRFALVILLLSLAAPAAAQAPASAPAPTPAPAPAPAPEAPSVALPPELDRVLRDYEAGWRAGDEAALAALFAPDGFVLSPGRPPVRGRDAIRHVYREMAGPLHLRALAYATDGSTGWIVGQYRAHPDQPDAGKFVLALRRGEDGRWLIAADMDNHVQHAPHN